MSLGDENRAMTGDMDFLFSRDGKESGFPKALTDVIKERSRQDAKWGEQNHSPEMWLTILMEEVGEAAQSILESKFGGSTDGQCGSQSEYRRSQSENYREECIQVSAVALAMVECYDRLNV
jgi:NTP pyrophosphatase (non-canonical NTP hydrolase)